MDHKVMTISEIKSLAILTGDLAPCEGCNKSQAFGTTDCMLIVVSTQKIRYCTCAKKEVFEGGLRQWAKEQNIFKTA